MRATVVGALVLTSAVVVSKTASTARAESAPPPGAAALRQARAAWERGSFVTAEPLYREAIEKGGLAPDELVEGYVRLGAMRASAGKKEQAVAAFRAAAILDAGFSVPAEAGAKGAALATQAKKDTERFGSIRFAAEAPKDTPAGKGFRVTAHLDAAHLKIVSRVAISARDGTTGKEFSREAKPEEAVDFDVPSDLTLPQASVLVRVDALDRNQNRLASAEERVRVTGDLGTVAAGGANANGSATAGGSGSGSGSAASSSATSPPDESPRKGGSFWSSPWPYIIGGVALAGAGAAVYFGTRPLETVPVGQVGVGSK
jgi:hypothetical protein